MAKPYRLTPAQWESIERYAEDNAYDACFLELRARIKALEAAQQKIRSASESPLVSALLMQSQHKPPLPASSTTAQPAPRSLRWRRGSAPSAIRLKPLPLLNRRPSDEP